MRVRSSKISRVGSYWSVQQRLDYRTVRDPETGCLLWIGTRTARGYGRLSIGGKFWLAHRAAWMTRNGPIPAGLFVCHRCDVRTCINPDHLYLGTAKDNAADIWAKRGQEPRVEGPERRPSKAPEIIRLQFRGQEYVTRLLEVRSCNLGAAADETPLDEPDRRLAVSQKDVIRRNPHG